MPRLGERGAVWDAVALMTTAARGSDPGRDPCWQAEGPVPKNRPSCITWWRGVQAMTHPSSYKPDEVAGQDAMRMHCIGQPPDQRLRHIVGVPRNSSSSPDLRVPDPKADQQIGWRAAPLTNPPAASVRQLFGRVSPATHPAIPLLAHRQAGSAGGCLPEKSARWTTHAQPTPGLERCPLPRDCLNELSISGSSPSQARRQRLLNLDTPL